MQRVFEIPIPLSLEDLIDYHCFIDRADIDYRNTSKRIDDYDELVKRSYMKLSDLADF